MVFSFEETFDVLKGFPFCLALPFVIVAALSCTADGSHEFPVFRMYQYELHGSSFGMDQLLLLTTLLNFLNDVQHIMACTLYTNTFFLPFPKLVLVFNTSMSTA